MGRSLALRNSITIAAALLALAACKGSDRDSAPHPATASSPERVDPRATEPTEVCAAFARVWAEESDPWDRGFYTIYAQVSARIRHDVSPERARWFDELAPDDPVERARNLRSWAQALGVGSCPLADTIEQGVAGDMTDEYATLTLSTAAAYARVDDSSVFEDHAAQTGRTAEQVRVITFAAGCGDVPACARACFELLGAAPVMTAANYEAMARVHTRVGPCDAPIRFEQLELWVATRLLVAIDLARPHLDFADQARLDRAREGVERRSVEALR